VRGLRRFVFILVVGALLAAIPLSAVASENFLSSSVRQAEVAFNQSLSVAVGGGLQKAEADSLMWRYSEVQAIKPSAWWQVPVAEHTKLDKIGQLQSELNTIYQMQLTDSRDALQRQLHRWNLLVAEVKGDGISADGLDLDTTRFAAGVATPTTPNRLNAMATVLSEQYAILDGRMAAFRGARAQVDAAAENARTLLASAARYPQLGIAGFRDQLTAALAGVDSVRSADAFAPVLARLQQTAAGVQGLLNARAGAYNQLADTRSTLASAQRIGAVVGNRAGVINALAGQLGSAGDQGTFQSLTSQLYQQKQALASAIFTKQMAPVSYKAGVGKLIVISLSRQVLTAYQDGNAVLTTFVATGRPQLPTPPGVYRIFHKYSPYKFISPWPYSSPYWYPSAWTSFAMEFIAGGYFIHDAPWRSWYGPGSNTYNGTHGCVNVPYSPMSFLWNWAPIGTTVVVQY
jgi:lipoprotein-anchoring transpeptidase ErfK/SrfK